MAGHDGFRMGQDSVEVKKELILIFTLFAILRSVKCSLKQVINLQSWEKMSTYWKTEILTEVRFVWRKEPREVCGVIMDPVEFIHQYMMRYLARRELEGDPLAPGYYDVEYKV